MKATARKLETVSELSLKDSELRYRRLFEATQDGILILDAKTGMIEDVNPSLIKMLGYSRDEFIKRKLWEVGAFKDIEASKEAFEALQENKYIRYEDLPLRARDGRLIQVEFVSSVYLVGGEEVIQCDIRDITEHRRIIAALQENEKKYRDLINQSPDGFFIIELLGKIVTVNKAMCEELKFSEEEFLTMNIWDIIPEQYLEQYRERLTKILQGESLKEAAEYEVRGKDGKTHYVEVLSAPHYSGKDIIGFQGIARDLSARKRAEETLRLSEEKYRALVDEVNDGFYETDEAGVFTYANPTMTRIYGMEAPQTLVGRKFMDFLPPEMLAALSGERRSTMHTGQAPEVINSQIVRPDGTRAFIEIKPVSIIKEGQIVGSRGVVRNTTERKQAEDELKESKAIVDTVVDNIPLMLFLKEASDLRFVLFNRAGEELLGYDRKALLGKNNLDLFPPEQAAYFMAKDMEALNGEAGILDIPEEPIQTAKKGLRLLHTRKVCIRGSDGTVKYLLGISEDITERKQAEARIQRQLEHLTALSTIDRFIAGIFDLKLSLTEILTHVTRELGVDAADILTLNSNLQILESGAERGFRTEASRNTQVQLGGSHAGRAVLKRHLVTIPDLRAEPDIPARTTRLKDEAFVSYYGVPLIFKGKVNGVLEIFHRLALEPDPEWFDFLNSLAGQAAIAIDNVTLFENLQRSNTELSLAYDATIEGWSRALDLRDKETEGHTQRVTEMTVKLGRLFGLGEAELVQVRWGALLHDIGKMGVPDGILLKPGPLTDKEWLVMKKHPALAHEMLAPISYLRLALDIPYCHHEKWDGSGYPRGLKGTQIPLVARIFAVVDVWDALRSDRPYRPAWTEEKVRQHIQGSSGTHFDPKVVDAFMQILD